MNPHYKETNRGLSAKICTSLSLITCMSAGQLNAANIQNIFGSSGFISSKYLPNITLDQRIIDDDPITFGYLDYLNFILPAEELNGSFNIDLSNVHLECSEAEFVDCSYLNANNPSLSSTYFIEKDSAIILTSLIPSTENIIFSCEGQGENTACISLAYSTLGNGATFVANVETAELFPSGANVLLDCRQSEDDADCLLENQSYKFPAIAQADAENIEDIETSILFSSYPLTLECNGDAIESCLRIHDRLEGLIFSVENQEDLDRFLGFSAFIIDDFSNITIVTSDSNLLQDIILNPQYPTDIDLVFSEAYPIQLLTLSN